MGKAVRACMCVCAFTHHVCIYSRVGEKDKARGKLNVYAKPLFNHFNFKRGHHKVCVFGGGGLALRLLILGWLSVTRCPSNGTVYLFWHFPLHARSPPTGSIMCFWNVN